MVQQVRFLSKIYFLVLVLLACNKSNLVENNRALNIDSVNLQTQGGITYFNGNPFSGKVFQLLENGKDTLSVQEYKNGKEDGTWKQFYSTNKIKELRYFKAGLKEGKYTSWWENGKLKAIYLFKNGEYEGPFKEWLPNGKLYKEMHYHKGYEEGSQKVWYDSGKIKSNYQMVNGRRFGLLGTKNCVNVSDSLFKK